jgi:hypothetical protein
MKTWVTFQYQKARKAGQCKIVVSIKEQDHFGKSCADEATDCAKSAPSPAALYNRLTLLKMLG